ncbi:MAG: ROK family transcriptional regulator [Lachnospiraceae bacterium]|nr:ROK family transcriptional regulator [Lachnospiraceae bacterium]
MVAYQSWTKINNQRDIIEALITEGDMSRVGLAKKLSLSKPATSENVGKLIEAGLIFEVGVGNSTLEGGRKPRLLRFNQKYRSIVAVDLSYRQPILAVGDLTGEILAETKLSVALHEDKKQKVELLIAAIEDILKKVENIELGMIVVSSPGIFTPENKLMFAHAQHGWSNIGLVEGLTERFGVSVIVKNDMNAAVLAEHTLGSGIGCDNMAYVSCGVGLGAGLIINGELYEGKNFAAGEISFVLEREGTGKTKSIEEIVTIESLLERIRREVKSQKVPPYVANLFEKKERIEFSDIVNLAMKKDPYTIAVIEEVGEKLGVVLGTISALLNVEKIVLGGEYLEFFDILKWPIRKTLTKVSPFPPKFAPSALGEKVGLLGGFIFGRNILLQEFTYALT